ncbi:MAG: Uma2 family endonuclease [Candidatus Magnetobacterium sp. LHC-1]|uniref:Uma2 family endonuclease n=1 Tax=Candidatus Magnetobacterium casense TaxID=1455061 RepID=A0ABS6S156_9BACT|nr:Uma2 family endonuclease [Candidatus Magnetobacterium casensis]MBF0609043.1 Uma2 family endonuclease [Nitrospirota bacterium]MBV6342586.1 Uma2 family endonuclease [Candidatus Magnetobacterium casensis]
MQGLAELSTDLDLTEIINGERIMPPSPFGKHQRISQRINHAIYTFVTAKKIGEVYYSPLDVILEEGVNRLQPDLLFISNENIAIFQDWVRGVPDMVCEIVSKGTSAKDMITKRDIYQRYGVPEYWIVIPELEMIEILTLKDSRYELFSYAECSGVVKSRVMDGLEIDIEAIFRT